jgi:DNA-binding NarL/FixJ family response regulator
LDLIQDLAASCPGVPVLIFSMFQESVYAKRALEVGARGYVMKTEQSGRLLAAIRSVLAGAIFVSPAMANRLLEFVSTRSQKRRTGVDALSPREFEVFRLIGEGVSTVTIANRLHMSPKTVDSHREHMKQKLEIRTMSELIAFASQWEATEGIRG